MPQAQCVKYPVKPGQRERLVEWIAGLEGRSAELREALAEGEVMAEAVFLERSDDGDHVLIYTRAEDLRAAMEALAKSELPLVREFNRLLGESVEVEKAVSLELVYHTP